ncbi:MAG: hypothetical protein IKE03_07825 [Blautia sp.]|nr:hypothetical protein [Blautia sp.]
MAARISSVIIESGNVLVTYESGAKKRYAEENLPKTVRKWMDEQRPEPSGVVEETAVPEPVNETAETPISVIDETPTSRAAAPAPAPITAIDETATTRRTTTAADNSHTPGEKNKSPVPVASRGLVFDILDAVETVFLFFLRICLSIAVGVLYGAAFSIRYRITTADWIVPRVRDAEVWLTKTAGPCIRRGFRLSISWAAEAVQMMMIVVG